MKDSLIEEPGTSAKPKWLDLPDKDHYWTCTGTNIYTRTVVRRTWWGGTRQVDEPLDRSGVWLQLYYTQEEAEAGAVEPNKYWIWDKKPAKSYLLKDSMGEARRDGLLGVLIKSYRGGQWVTVKKYPVGIPLPE